MGLCDFSSAEVGNRIHKCVPKEYTLWLRHTKEYNLVNAYNLAVMATLAYSDVRTDKEEGDRDVKQFLDNMREKRKLKVFKKENLEATTSVDQLVKEVPIESKAGIRQFGHMIDKATSTQAFWFADEEHIVLAVRGTQEIDKDIILDSLLKGSGKAPDDAVIDLDGEQVNMAGVQGQVHRGFRTQAEAIVNSTEFKDNFIGAASGKKLFVTGHSLGAAVATILAAYLKGRGLDPLLYTYGSPRVGNETFVKAYSAITHYRHVYHHDIVPLVPGRNLDMGIPELKLCAVSGLMSGMGNPVLTLGTLSSSLYLCSKNWSGPGYYHHGDLCQIVSAGSGSIMAPFKWHGIVSERIRKLLKEKKSAQRDLAHVKHEKVDTDNSGISNPLEWWRHYNRVDDAQERLQKAKEALEELPDDRNDDYSLAAAIHGEVSDHFMSEGYLPFLKKEIQIEWRLFKENHCEHKTIEKSRRSILYSRIDRAIKRVKKEIAHQRSIIKSIYNSGAMNDQLSAGRIDMYHKTQEGIRIHEAVIEAAAYDLARLEEMKSVRIGSYSIYNLRAGDPELNKQLEKF